MAVKLNQHDLEFILKQIKIAEAHVAGTPLTQLIDQPHLPYGLRTVDGTYNNLIPGRETWGASDQPMPRMFDPRWSNENDETGIDINRVVALRIPTMRLPATWWTATRAPSATSSSTRR
jgi:hypothetical protein